MALSVQTLSFSHYVVSESITETERPFQMNTANGGTLTLSLKGNLLPVNYRGIYGRTVMMSPACNHNQLTTN